mmetsp:Transcript_19410/g.35167  ORF Transcript_19410/g.35167 Transcript_19410/m.35167 type:complete len:143 (-) Transcript_19410:128-556(-)
MAEIFYVPKESLERLIAKAQEGKEEVSEDDIQALTNPMDADDEACMIPVDMRGVEGNDNYDDIDDLVAALGPKAAVEAFRKARDYFDNNTGGDEQEGRAVAMTGRELKERMMEEIGEGAEEGEEEEEGEADGEPANKKAKVA